MKKLILIILISLPLMGFAQQGAFVLSGKVAPHADPTIVYLSYRLSDIQKTDSSMVENGVFQFKGKLVEPAKAQLFLRAKNTDQNTSKAIDAISIFLENGELKLNSKDSLKNAVILNSKLNTQYMTFQANSDKYIDTLKKINLEYSGAPKAKRKDSVFLKEMTARYDKTMNGLKELQMKFIKKNPNSFLSLQLLRERAQQEADLQLIESTYKSLTENLQETPTGKSLEKLLIALKSTTIGSQAPDFSQNDVDGKPIRLSEFKGKYVLIDFWASWCGPCRQENPNVVKAFDQFKDKGLSILGVSLDSNKAAWLNAIKVDGLSWTQVSDLKFWNNEVSRLYGIRSIPQNFLIGPSGEILGKNLRGGELIKTLTQLMK